MLELLVIAFIIYLLSDFVWAILIGIEVFFSELFYYLSGGK